MELSSKLIPIEELARWRAGRVSESKTVVVTNGCFDVLHRGHVTYLCAARELGDVLLVGVNSDDSVKALKGDARPINPQMDRALVLAALEAVDGICFFPDLKATRFLSFAQPDIYVKGGDYTLEKLDREERAVVEDSGGAIRILPLVPGRSTSSMLERIARL